MVHFPNECPYTGNEFPEGEIVLHRTSDRGSLMIPLIGLSSIFMTHSFSRVELRLPADKRFCLRVRILDIVMAVFLLLGPCIAAPMIVLRMMDIRDRSIALPVSVFCTSFVVVVVCGIARLWLTRNLRLVDHFDGRIKLRFRSETYAKEFARLNRCGIDDK